MSMFLQKSQLKHELSHFSSILGSSTLWGASNGVSEKENTSKM